MPLPSSDPRDLYKSIVLRESLQRSFNRDREGGWARRLAAIGESDNRIGGLFGKENFYGETLIPGEFTPATDLDTPIVSTTSLVWSPVIIGRASATFTYSVIDGGAILFVRENQRWDPNLATWVDAPGNIGVLIQHPFIAPIWQFQFLENSLTSLAGDLMAFQARDILHPTALIAGAAVSGSGKFRATDQDRSAIRQVRDSMFIDTAEGKYLTRCGANQGVPRPPQSPFDDTLFRKIIPILSWLPKTPKLVAYRLAEAIFGTQADLIAANGRAWEFFEVNPNEIIFECPVELISANQSIASYMHGYPGSTLAIVGPTNTFTFIGSDARKAGSGNSINGRTVYLFFGGVWNTYTISSASYNAGTQTNTIVVSAATIPTGNNYPFFVDIPGANSFPGDFMLASAAVVGGDLNPPTSQLVYLYGQGLLDIFSFYMDNFVRAAGVVLRKEIL